MKQTLIKTLGIPKTSAGFTLIELLVAISLTTIVVSVTGFGLVNIASANNKAEADTQRRVNLNRALDFISDEVRTSVKVSDARPSWWDSTSWDLGGGSPSANLFLQIPVKTLDSIPTSGLITVNNHGLSTGNAVMFTGPGTLPTGLSKNQKYYVVRIDDNTFKVSTTVNGTAISSLTGGLTDRVTLNKLVVYYSRTSPNTWLGPKTISRSTGDCSVAVNCNVLIDSIASNGGIATIVNSSRQAQVTLIGDLYGDSTGTYQVKSTAFARVFEFLGGSTADAAANAAVAAAQQAQATADQAAAAATTAQNTAATAANTAAADSSATAQTAAATAATAAATADRTAATAATAAATAATQAAAALRAAGQEAAAQVYDQKAAAAQAAAAQYNTAAQAADQKAAQYTAAAKAAADAAVTAQTAAENTAAAAATAAATAATQAATAQTAAAQTAAAQAATAQAAAERTAAAAATAAATAATQAAVALRATGQEAAAQVYDQKATAAQTAATQHNTAAQAADQKAARYTAAAAAASQAAADLANAQRFTTTTPGTLTFNQASTVSVQVLGGAINCGNVPISTTTTINVTPSGQQTTSFGLASSTQSLNLTAAPGAKVTLTGASLSNSNCPGFPGYSFNSSTNNNTQVLTLRNGDTVPSYQAYGNQRSIASFLQQYIDPVTRKITIRSNQAIFLFELGVVYDPRLGSNNQNPAYDMQDLVVLATVTP